MTIEIVANRIVPWCELWITFPVVAHSQRHPAVVVLTGSFDWTSNATISNRCNLLGRTAHRHFHEIVESVVVCRGWREKETTYRHSSETKNNSIKNSYESVSLVLCITEIDKKKGKTSKAIMKTTEKSKQEDIHPRHLSTCVAFRDGMKFR